MNSLKKIITIALLYLAVIFISHPAVADTLDSNASNSVRQAAKEVVKETGVKEQFGQSKNGEQLLDKAQSKASKKLTNLAEKASSQADLPKSEKLFLKNLQK